MSTQNINDKLVMVSGGSRGLGLSICEYLLGCGYDVVSFSRKKTAETTQLKSTHGDQYNFFEADMSDQDALQYLTQRVEKTSRPSMALLTMPALPMKRYLRARMKPPFKSSLMLWAACG